jgi:ribosomal protein S18 acetylase RimI-like enzyme
MSIDVHQLLEPSTEVEDYLRKDLPFNGLPLYDLTLAWDASTWFIARSQRKLVGCLIVYEGGRGLYPSFFTRGDSTAVDLLVASISYPTLFAIVPQSHVPLVEKYYQFLSHGEFLLMNLKEFNYQLPKKPTTERLTSEALNEVDAFYRATMAGAWSPVQLDIGPFYGIREQGKLISICGTIGVYHRNPGVSVIGNLVTLPAYQNRGYGTSVLCSVINDLSDDYRYITLMVDSNNPRAIHIYERLGFIVHTKLAIGLCQRRR